MTIKEQIETTYQNALGLEDIQSVETVGILGLIKLRIESEEFNSQMPNIKETRLARILEVEIMLAEDYIDSEDEETARFFQFKKSLLESFVPLKLTTEELTQTIQGFITESPEISFIEIVGLLDDFYYDMTSVESIYVSLKS